MIKVTILCISVLISSMTAIAAEPSNAELLAMIKQQQKQIEALMAIVNQNKKAVEDNKIQVTETDDKVEATVDAIERSLVNTQVNKTQIGGYGELHYNNIEENEQIDFHRFVLFFGHEFTESIRFFSELEIEHALSGNGKPGEVELEQAYIEMDLSDSTRLKSGLFLLPIGIINETHEPPTFYGVERNPIEKNIIPATWWEAGVAINHQIADGWNADFAIHSGLNVPTEGSKAFLIRSGRQKAAKANADSLAYTARLKYTAIPGLELATAYQRQDDVTQGELDASASLFTAHAIYHKNNFAIKALYASWNINGSEAELIGRDKQDGFFLEPSYKMNDSWGIFARYNSWNNQSGTNADTEMHQTNFGINSWLHENIVFKFDIEKRSGATDENGFNLGVGYMFN